MGGVALGLERAGFDTIGLIEFDKSAAQTLKNNRPSWNVVNDDIANISKLDLESYFEIKKGELDLLSGGAPCQAFSYAGKRLGLDDARNFKQVVKQWERGKITFEEALQQTGLKQATFYNRLREHRAKRRKT